VLKKLYSIAGRVLSIATLDGWSAEAVANLLDAWYIVPLADDAKSADASIRISFDIAPPEYPSNLTTFEISDGGMCHTDGTSSYLKFGSSLVIIDASNDVSVWIAHPDESNPPVVAQILSQAFSAALRRCGLFEFHSGAAVPPNESSALLIAGASGSGKSTITSQLATAGWSYLSDDTLLLRQSGPSIEAAALRKFFALTATTIAALPAAGPANANGKSKERFSPQELFPSHPIETAKPTAIVFPIITHESESRLQPLSPAETMSRLIRLCPWACYDAVSANEHLNLLGHLARETRGFDMLAGTDLLRDQLRTVDLAYQAHSKH
jgi:hypothetical protein